MRRFPHNIPYPLISNTRQLPLSLLPILILTLLPRTHHRDRNPLGQNRLCSNDFVTGDCPSRQTFLKLASNDTVGTPGTDAPDTVFTRSMFEDPAGETVDAKGGDDAAEKEDESSRWGEYFGDEGFGDGVDEEETFDLGCVTRGKDTGI